MTEEEIMNLHKRLGDKFTLRFVGEFVEQWEEMQKKFGNTKTDLSKIRIVEEEGKK